MEKIYYYYFHLDFCGLMKFFNDKKLNKRYFLTDSVIGPLLIRLTKYFLVLVLV